MLYTFWKLEIWSLVGTVIVHMNVHELLFTVTVQCHPDWVTVLPSDSKWPENCVGESDNPPSPHPWVHPQSPDGVRSGPAGLGASPGLSAMTGPAPLLSSTVHNTTTSEVSLRMESFHCRQKPSSCADSRLTLCFTSRKSGWNTFWGLHLICFSCHLFIFIFLEKYSFGEGCLVRFLLYVKPSFWCLREVRLGEESKAFSLEMQGSFIVFATCVMLRKWNVRKKRKKMPYLYPS